MGKYVLIVIFSLLNIVGFSQSLSFSEKLYNFGTILEESGEVEHKFIITNISDIPFVINFITTGCGCTEAEYDKSPLFPKQKREIVIKYDPRNRAGLFRTAINIVGASPQEDYMLHVIGNIVPRKRTVESLFPISYGKLRIKGDIIAYGLIPNREIHTNFIEYYNTSDKKIAISVANLDKTHSKCWVTKKEIAPNQRGYIMYELSLADSDYLGDIDDKITISINGVQQRNKIDISATVIPNFFGLTAMQIERAGVATVSEISHTIEDFSEQNCSYSFKVLNSGETELRILKTIVRGRDIECETQFMGLAAGETGTITLRLTPRQGEQKQVGRVTFITDSPHTTIFTLTLIGEIK